MVFNIKNKNEALAQSFYKGLKKVQKQNSDEISDRLLKIGQDCAKRLKKPFRSAEHGDLLYNEKGLPK